MDNESEIIVIDDDEEEDRKVMSMMPLTPVKAVEKNPIDACEDNHLEDCTICPFVPPSNLCKMIKRGQKVTCFSLEDGLSLGTDAAATPMHTAVAELRSAHLNKLKRFQTENTAPKIQGHHDMLEDTKLHGAEKFQTKKCPPQLWMECDLCNFNQNNLLPLTHIISNLEKAVSNKLMEQMKLPNKALFNSSLPMLQNKENLLNIATSSGSKGKGKLQNGLDSGCAIATISQWQVRLQSKISPEIATWFGSESKTMLQNRIESGCATAMEHFLTCLDEVNQQYHHDDSYVRPPTPPSGSINLLSHYSDEPFFPYRKAGHKYVTEVNRQYEKHSLPFCCSSPDYITEVRKQFQESQEFCEEMQKIFAQK